MTPDEHPTRPSTEGRRDPHDPPEDVRAVDKTVLQKPRADELSPPPGQVAPIDETQDAPPPVLLFGAVEPTVPVWTPRSTNPHDGEAFSGRRVGPFRLIRHLGSGGMGQVFEADDGSGRRVALKLIRNVSLTSDSTVDRFRREGKLASMINHPRCVFVVTADECEGHPYIVMELMRGGTLEEYVQRHGPLDPVDAIHKILDVIDGLSASHQMGILHRDIKPSNCYLDEDERVKIGDFGLARAVELDLNITEAGGFVGTVLFSAPEQLKGDQLDVRADVYSVAATLYWMVTGRAPHGDSKGLSAVARAVSEPPRTPKELRPQLPPKLERVIMKGLELDRDRRFQDLDQFRAALEKLLPIPLATPALGRRVWAYLIDGIPIAAPAALYSMAVSLGTIDDVLEPFGGVWVAESLLFFVYFLVCESVFGATLGKRLTRLCVIRASTTSRARFGLILVRTSLFLLLTGTGSDLAGWLARWTRNETLPIYSLGIYWFFLVLMVAPMRRSTGYRGLHELISGTRVGLVPPHPFPSVLQRKLERRAVAIARLKRRRSRRGQPTPRPRLLGPFELGLAVIGPRGATTILEAEERVLGRKVWIIHRTPNVNQNTGPSRTRLETARPSRLRWLTSGTDELSASRWDAYLQPTGEFLANLVTPRHPLGWTDTRRLLLELALELDRSLKEGTLPARLSTTLVWVTEEGSALLLDDLPSLEPPESTRAGSPSNVRADEPAAIALLGRTAVLALEGKTRPLNQITVRAAVPQHAREIIDRLTGVETGYESLKQVIADLESLLHSPTEVTRGDRVFQLAILAGILLIPFGFMITLSNLPATARLHQLDKNLVLAQALEQASRDPRFQKQLSRLAEQAETAGPSQAAGPSTFQAWTLYRDQVASDARAQYRSLGMLARAIDAIPGVVLLASENFRFPSLALESFDSPSGPGLTVILPEVSLAPNLKLDAELIQAYARIVAQPMTAFERHDRVFDLLAERDLAPRIDVWERRAISQRLPYALLIMPVLGIVGTLILGFALSYRLVGISLVRIDGRPAGRLRRAWRLVLFWSPLALTLGGVMVVDLVEPGQLWVSNLLRWAFLGLLVAYVGFTIQFPRCGPLDLLARTRVVPR